LPHRTISIQRACLARIARRLRDKTRAKENSARERRSASSGMDAGETRECDAAV